MNEYLSLGGTQQSAEQVSISSSALLIVCIALVVAYVVAKNPELSVPIGTAAAVAAVLIVFLVPR